MKKLCVFFVLLLCATSVNAQWQPQKSIYFPDGKALTAISFVDEDYGWAVSNQDFLLKTTDGGNTWVSINYLSFQSVKFFDRQTGYADSYGKIYKSTDGGHKWTLLKGIGNLVNVFYIGIDTIVVRDAFGKIYKTIDEQTWDTIDPPIGYQYVGDNMFFLNASTGWVTSASSTNGVYKTTDGGITWTKNTLPTAYQVFFIDEMNGWARSEDYIQKTTDGGETWHKISQLGQNYTESSMRFINKDDGAIIQGNSQFYTTTDGGKTWLDNSFLYSNAGNSFTIIDYYYLNSDTIWLIGRYSSGSSVYKYTTEKFIKFLEPGSSDTVFTNYQFDIKWYCSNIIPSKGKIEYSIDNGQTWSLAADSVDLSALHYLWKTKEDEFASSTQGQIRITDYENQITGTTDNNFTFFNDSKKITLLNPIGDEKFIGADSIEVKWTTNYTSKSNAVIQLLWDDGYGESVLETWETKLGNMSYKIPVNGTWDVNCRLSIYDKSIPHISASSDYFLIWENPRLSVYKPQSFEIWQGGQTYNIILITTHVQSVKLDYTTDSGDTWNLITDQFTADSTLQYIELNFPWKIPLDISSKHCMIRVTANDDPSVSDTSATFRIISQNETIGLFPLQTGNIWYFHYHESNQFNPAYNRDYLSTIIKDSTTVEQDDGKYYHALYQYGWIDSTTEGLQKFKFSKVLLYRQDGNYIYQYGDTSSVIDFTNPFSMATVFNKNVHLYGDPGGLGLHGPEYADSIGFYLLSSYAAPHSNSSSTYLTGCVLNGTTYGTIPNWEKITGVKKETAIPISYLLNQNYPNPFNPTTTISYSIPKLSHVSIAVCDILGREIVTLVNEEKTPGNYKVNFNGSNLASGIYFYRITAGDFVSTKKFVLLK